MFDLTVRHMAGRIHLGKSSGDFSDCAEYLTHIVLDPQEAGFWDYLYALKQDPMAMSYLRQLLGQTGLSHGVTRTTDHQAADQVAKLLQGGYLTAVMCGVESVAPAAALAIEGKRFHVCLGLYHLANCEYQGSHSILRFDSGRLTANFFEKLVGDSENVRELRRFALAQSSLKDLAPNSPVEIVVEKLIWLLTSHRVTLVECKTSSFPLAGDIGEEERAPTKAGKGAGTAVKDKVKTWIEIRLVDMDGHPVPNEKYQLKLPDGTMQEGALDAKGHARVEQIDPGDCTVSFPDIDGREWKRA
jgi:hypothetical protein